MCQNIDPKARRWAAGIFLDRFINDPRASRSRTRTKETRVRGAIWPGTRKRFPDLLLQTFEGMDVRWAWTARMIVAVDEASVGRGNRPGLDTVRISAGKVRGVKHGTTMRRVLSSQRCLLT